MNVFVKTDNGNYELRPEFKEMKQFKVLERRTRKIPGDTDGRKKLLNKKELSFIYFFAYFGSMYRKYDSEERIHEIKIVLDMPDNWKPDKEVKDAVKLYVTLQKTKSWRAYKAVEEMEENTRLYIEIKNEELKDGNMDPKTVKEFLSLSDELNKLITAKDILKAKLEKEHDNIHGLTGRKGRTLNSFELKAPDFVKNL